MGIDKGCKNDEIGNNKNHYILIYMSTPTPKSNNTAIIKLEQDYKELLAKYNELSSLKDFKLELEGLTKITTYATMERRVKDLEQHVSKLDEKYWRNNSVDKANIRLLINYKNDLEKHKLLTNLNSITNDLDKYTKVVKSFLHNIVIVLGVYIVLTLFSTVTLFFTNYLFEGIIIFVTASVVCVFSIITITLFFERKPITTE
ncbi:MAG: hypothetical protein WBA74_08995 [Cyclobacteriaceae bacterium]